MKIEKLAKITKNDQKADFLKNVEFSQKSVQIIGIWLGMDSWHPKGSVKTLVWWPISKKWKSFYEYFIKEKMTIFDPQNPYQNP